MMPLWLFVPLCLMLLFLAAVAADSDFPPVAVVPLLVLAAVCLLEAGVIR
jgi:hypothetical protein